MWIILNLHIFMSAQSLPHGCWAKYPWGISREKLNNKNIRQIKIIIMVFLFTNYRISGKLLDLAEL